MPIGGHVSLIGTLRSRLTRNDSWEATITTWIEAGEQAKNLAADVREFPHPERRTRAGVEVRVRRPGRSEQVQLILVNEGAEPVDLTVADAYQPGRTKSYRVRPGKSVVHNAKLDANNGWYDLTVTAAQDTAYLRGVAGHVETGRVSTSDPAFGAR
ncbi:DUF6228 family protein [Embleya scabrispora]|uniref:DUF6228 family protein n=1 Tax=Embleya scabrispora TaxID=159449 RepID=UPI000361D0EE|nr:DUF6228 family protein [Embleya scabrispora]MYS85134.1 DUF756 domain-containing protein [Streptomyces sp. SID5474]